jgi:hypothetical protein
MRKFKRMAACTVVAILMLTGGCGDDTTVKNSTIVDPDHPRLVGVAADSNTGVIASFSTALLGGLDSAENAAHYQISERTSATPSGKPASGATGSRKGYLNVTSATLGADGKSVKLVTMSQSDIEYLLTVTNVKDTAGRPIAGSSGADTPATMAFRGRAPDLAGQVDTDGDGLIDSVEQRGWTVTVLGLSGQASARTVTSDPTTPDTDGDGIGDAMEKQFGIDPRSKDTDTDELTDFQELVEIFSDPARQDTDGDSLSDGLEFNFFKTSPSLADSDGDQIKDGDEIQLANRNPRLSDLPLPGVEVGDVDLRLDVRFRAESSAGSRDLETKDVATTLSQSNSRLFSNSDSSTNKFFAKVGVEQGWGVKEGGASGKFSFETGYSGEWMSSTRRDTAEESQKAYHDSLSTSAEVTKGETVVREVRGASMKVSLNLRNLGDIAFSIRNIQVTALLQDPRDPTVLLPLATLVADPSAGGPVSVNLGPLIPMRGPFVYANDQVYPSLVEDLMKDPRGLVFKIANFDITDEFGRNFAFTSQGINDRTGALVIDYGGADPDGDLEGELTERLRVSTAAGRPLYDTDGNGVVDDRDRRVLFDREGRQVGITVRDALENALGLKHYDEDQSPGAGLTVQQRKESYSTRGVDVDTDGNGTPDRTVRMIWRIRDVSRDDSPLKKWSVLTPTGIDDHVDVFERLIRTGEGLVFAFVQDLDDDGIPASWEYLYGCSDLDKDSDDDGLDDRLEVFEGWPVEVQGRGSVRVRSSCARPDTDGDRVADAQEKALGLDPKKVDTDTDGVNDAEEIEGYRVELRFAFDSASSRCQPIIGAPPGTIACRTSPLDPDFDRDGGRDGDEIAYGTDPTVNDGDKFLDEDKDGLVNFFEERVGWTVHYNERHATCEEQGSPANCSERYQQEGPERSLAVNSDPRLADADRDGLSDRMERDLGTDPNTADTDGDGLSDSAEVRVTWTSATSYTFQVLTDPLDADTDDDLRSDGAEVNAPWIVYVTGQPPVQVYSGALVFDADFDGMPDYAEYRHGTHPQQYDTDSDRYGDGAEVAVTRQTDPLTPDQLVNFRYLAVTSKGECDWNNAGDFYGKWQLDARGVHGNTDTGADTLYNMSDLHLTDGTPHALPTSAQRAYVMRAGDVVRAQIVDVYEYDWDNDDELDVHTPKEINYEVTNGTYTLQNQESGSTCGLDTTLVVTVK